MSIHHEAISEIVTSARKISHNLFFETEKLAVSKAMRISFPEHVFLRNAAEAASMDRHRGSGCPLTPATPPCVRVRTRRFDRFR